jgi:hypothetical protein
MAIESDIHTTSVTIADMLRERGITSGRKLAQHVEAPAVIYFLLKGEKGRGEDPRAELHFQGIVRTYRPEGDTSGMTVRSMVLQTTRAAEDDAYQLMGLNDWRKTPFSNCWLPGESINRMREELGLDRVP